MQPTTAQITQDAQAVRKKTQSIRHLVSYFRWQSGLWQISSCNLNFSPVISPSCILVLFWKMYFSVRQEHLPSIQKFLYCQFSTWRQNWNRINQHQLSNFNLPTQSYLTLYFSLAHGLFWLCQCKCYISKRKTFGYAFKVLSLTKFTLHT